MVIQGVDARRMRAVFRVLVVLLLGGWWTASRPAQARDVVMIRLGYQTSSVLISVLRAEGTLQRDLAAEGFRLRWSEFTSGLPLTEALNVGGIDVTGDMADTVPVFAQAAGAQFVYFAQEAPSPSGEAIVVPKGSPITTLRDLDGKTVAVARASGAHYLLLQALQSVGVSLADIHLSYLQPADARAALASGSIDAWSVWEPYISAVERQSGAHVLTDGRHGLASYQRYYLASSAFAAAHPRALRTIFRALQQAGLWAKAHPREAAKLLAPIWDLDEATVLSVLSHRSLRVRAVTPARLAEQQRIADVFFAHGLLDRHIDTARAGIWSPSP